MPTVHMGNVSPIDYLEVDEGSGQRVKHRHVHVTQSETVLGIQPYFEKGTDDHKFTNRGFDSAFNDVKNLWNEKSDQPPAWVSCPDDPRLERVIQAYWDCGEKPDDWENVYGDFRPPVPDEDELNSYNERKAAQSVGEPVENE